MGWYQGWVGYWTGGRICQSSRTRIVSMTRVCSTNHQELRRLNLPELALWRWSFFRQHLVSPPPVHLAKIYSRNTKGLPNFPFHLHSIHLSKFTRIYPFFFPLSTFPKFTRNFGGSTAREEGALPAGRLWANSEQLPSEEPNLRQRQRWGQLPSEVLTTALGDQQLWDQPIEDQEQGDFEKSWNDPNFSTSIPLMSWFFLSEVKVPIIRIWAETNRLRYLVI